MQSSSGQRWARGGLAFGALFSIIGNVTHTVMSTSAMTLWIRVPLAVVWPVALFIAVEILVRVDWRARFIDWLGRVLLTVPVSIVAAIVSYLHLHHLMQLAGEPGSASILGPVAVDGLMLGSTVALLAIRAASLAAEQLPEQAFIEGLETATEQAGPALDALGQTVQDLGPSMAALDEALEANPDFVAAREAFHANEARIAEQAKPRTRAPKATDEQMRKAVLALMDGKKVSEACELAGLDPDKKRAAVGRYNTVINKLRNDPKADVSGAAGIHPALLAEIEAWANLERVR
jgi:Protein of unknown function (DUF2637)